MGHWALGKFSAVCIFVCVCTLLAPTAPCPMSAHPLEDHSPFSAKTKAPKISEGLDPERLDPERLVDVTVVYPFPQFMDEQLEPREIKDSPVCWFSLLHNQQPQYGGYRQHTLISSASLGQGSDFNLVGPVPQRCDMLKSRCQVGCHLIRVSSGERSVSKLPRAPGRIPLLR